MAKRRKKSRTPKKSTAVPAPAFVGGSAVVSRSLRVGKRQIAEANRVAQEMGCGAPFGTDGMFRASRSQMKRYMRERNKRAVDLGEPRFVNFDGGYGDET